MLLNFKISIRRNFKRQLISRKHNEFSNWSNVNNIISNKYPIWTMRYIFIVYSVERSTIQTKAGRNPSCRVEDSCVVVG